MPEHRKKSGSILVLGLVAVLAWAAVGCHASKGGGTTLKASFTYSPAAPVVGGTVAFTDTSTGSPTSWSWDFGDGSTSTSENPGHSYSTAGSYTVGLTVAKSGQSSSASKSVTVTSTEAAVYYVDGSASGASDSNPGTEASPWKTISKANQALTAGDTVYIKAGSYSDYIAPVNSGADGLPITYANYGTDIVTITGASYGILLNGRSYIAVSGLAFYYLDRFMYLENGASHNIIVDCNFDQMRNQSEWAGSRIWESSSYNVVRGCRFSKYGACTGTPPSGDDSGVVLEIGNEESLTESGGTADNSDFNLVENNEMYGGGHHILGVMGRYNVIRNNYLHNEAWTNGRGNRTLYMNGYAADTGWCLIEGNRFAYAAPPCDDTMVSGTQLTSQHNIIRKNCFYFNDLAGLQFSVSSSYYQDILYNHVYNNTFFHNSQTSESDPGNCGVYFAIWSGSLVVKYNVLKNNLYYGQPAAHGVYRASLSDQTIASEYVGEDSGDPLFVNATATLGDPADDTYPDFDLQSGSPCIDAGGPLAYITSASGSGTSFYVDDAGYFLDGWGIDGVDGDVIRLIGTSLTATVTAVDYDTNLITVGSSLSWTKGQGVALTYVGSAPDAGACEYGSTSSSTAAGKRLGKALRAGRQLSSSASERSARRYRP